MKKYLSVFLLMLVLSCVLVGCAKQPDASDPSSPSSENSTESGVSDAVSAVQQARQEEIERNLAILQAMQPTVDTLNATLTQHIPEAYQSSDWFYSEALPIDENLFSIDMQIDIGEGDLEAAKAACLEIVGILEPEFVDYDIHSYLFSVVDKDGSTLCIISRGAESDGEFSLESDEGSQTFKAV